MQRICTTLFADVPWIRAHGESAHEMNERRAELVKRIAEDDPRFR